MTDPYDDELFDRRVRVKAPLSECGPRRFLWCEKRPEPCHVHGYRHSGDIDTNGHHDEEAGITGEISGTILGMNGGHPWIVRYDRLLEIAWPGGLTLRVNSGTYRLDELELL